jgi:hypothetical protein
MARYEIAMMQSGAIMGPTTLKQHLVDIVRQSGMTDSIPTRVFILCFASTNGRQAFGRSMAEAGSPTTMNLAAFSMNDDYWKKVAFEAVVSDVMAAIPRIISVDLSSDAGIAAIRLHDIGERDQAARFPYPF